MSDTPLSSTSKASPNGRPLGGRAEADNCASLPPSHPVAELMDEYCRTPTGDISPHTAMQIAQFAIDLYIRHYETSLRDSETRRRPLPTQESIRRLGLARTLRRKATRLYFES